MMPKDLRMPVAPAKDEATTPSTDPFVSLTVSPTPERRDGSVSCEDGRAVGAAETSIDTLSVAVNTAETRDFMICGLQRNVRDSSVDEARNE